MTRKTSKLNSLLHRMRNVNWTKLRHDFAQPGSPQKWFAGFIVLAICFLGYLVYLSSRQVPKIQEVRNSFANLPESVRKGGSKSYLQQKEALRRNVARTLRVSASEAERIIAENISLYLFPDLLEKDNFERQVAYESWQPLQEKIEAAPNSYQGRIWFEEMRANIWNYENADREAPKLSTPARTVIEIYNQLTTR